MQGVKIYFCTDLCWEIMFGTVYKVTNKSIPPNIWTESEGKALVPGDSVKLENDMMRFVMRNDSNTLDLVVDIPRLLDFEIMVRFITQGA